MDMKKWKPMFFEHSFVPKLLSRVSPIDIWAISLCGLVFCRGELSPQVKRHETIQPKHSKLPKIKNDENPPTPQPGPISAPSSPQPPPLTKETMEAQRPSP